MSKNYFIINLNKGESAETRMETIRERVRWGMFTGLFILLTGFNVKMFMVNSGYNAIIEKKKLEIVRLESEIKKLESTGKNLSKRDIMSLA